MRSSWFFIWKKEIKKLCCILIIGDSVQIESMIYEIRGKQVMLASDVAKLYQVETKVLNQTIKRNINRFPEKFCF